MKPARGGRGRARGPPPGFQEKESVPRGFQEASKEIKENLARHLDRQEQEELSDSGSDVDSEGAEELVEKMLGSYRGGGVDTGLLQEARNILKNFIQSSDCLICISSVKRTDSIWSCGTCFVSLHLICIQRWAKDTIFQQKQQLEDDPDRAEKEKKICWSCPKCRSERAPTTIPSAYVCYCGRERDPAFDPWQTPHSCGERCNRPLGGCGHKCALLCHPGPCPPCPQVVQQACHCGQAPPTTRRCSAAPWSCTQVCDQELGCRTHTCLEICHPGGAN